MGKAIIGEDLFPEIVDRYNTGGKTAAYDFLRSQYGIRHPYHVMKRIQNNGKYGYNPEKDRFYTTESDKENDVFLSMDELCGTAVMKTENAVYALAADRSAAIEKLVHELISDRLLALSRYITLDSSTRTILIDRTSLSADGYQIVSH